MKKDSFVIKRVDVGKLNALVINLMEAMDTDNPDEAVANINALKWVPQPSDRGWWFDESDEKLIRAKLRRFSHMRSAEWGRTLSQEGIKMDEKVWKILFDSRNLDFASEYDEIVIVRGRDWDDDGRTTSQIIHYGTKERTFVRLKPEDACIIRDRLTERDFKKMGLTGIVTMHEPINGHQLLVSENEKGQQIFRAMSPPDICSWPKTFGFAFGVKSGK